MPYISKLNDQPGIEPHTFARVASRIAEHSGSTHPVIEGGMRVSMNPELGTGRFDEGA